MVLCRAVDTRLLFFGLVGCPFVSTDLGVSVADRLYLVLPCAWVMPAVVGLIGGVKVYGKFSSGDPDTSKTAASWFGACIFLIVAATILRSFFL